MVGLDWLPVLQSDLFVSSILQPGSHSVQRTPAQWGQLCGRIQPLVAI
jgi:hypothetical protein